MATGIINNLSPFGKYLRIKLMEINKTQNWLSEQTRIHKTTLSQLARGERNDPDKIELIKEFLEQYQQSIA